MHTRDPLWMVLGVVAGAGCFRIPDPKVPDKEGLDTVDTQDWLDTSDTDTQDPGDDTGTPVDVATVPVAVVSDGANERVRYIRLDTATVVLDISMRDLHPTVCTGEYKCVVYGIEPSVAEETGADRLLLTYHRIRPLGSGNGIENLGSVVEQLEITEAGPAVVWSVSALDFQVHYPGRTDICASSVPCQVPSAGDPRNCRLQGTHDVEVIDTVEGRIRLLVADTATPSRALVLSVDPASTCAVVEDVVGRPTTPGWDRFENTNDADWVRWQGAPALLVNHKASALEQGGGAGMGKSTLWVPGEAGWVLLDEHPPPEVEGEGPSYLNAPHQSDMVEVGGQSYVVFAHSNGNGARFEPEVFVMEEDHFGTIGVLRLDGAEMVYLYDGLITKGAPLNFVRDVDWLGDGTWLVTDSGCNYALGEACTHPAAIRHLSFPLEVAPPTAPRQDGRWSRPQDRMVLREIEEVGSLFASPLTCDLNIPYEADFRWGAQLGAALQGRLRRTDLPTCAEGGG